MKQIHREDDKTRKLYKKEGKVVKMKLPDFKSESEEIKFWEKHSIADYWEDLKESDSCFFDDGGEIKKIEYHKSSIFNLQFRLVRVRFIFGMF